MPVCVTQLRQARGRADGIASVSPGGRVSVDISPRAVSATPAGSPAPRHVTPETPRTAATNSSSDKWERRYRLRLFLTDSGLIVVVVLGAHLLWFGQDSALASIKLFGFVDYWFVSSALALGWLAAMQFSGSRDSRVLGTGSREYQLVFNACFAWFGIVAILATLLKIDIARGYLLIAFPAGVVFLLAGRKLWRIWLNRQRKLRGAFSARVMVIGSASSVSNMVRELRLNPHAGYHVVGVCIPDGATLSPDVDLTGLHFGSLESPVTHLRLSGGNTIAVAGGDMLKTSVIRKISWQLAPGAEHLIVSPNLIDIAGPRIHTRPVSGLSLIHVETPKYSGAKLFMKNLFDFIGALLLTITLSPIFAAVAIAVRLSSDGPVFFKQTRIGRDGKPFEMLKFRSMTAGAHVQLADLLAAQGTSGTPLFKVHNDPRVTRVGNVLRRYSLDELPQIFNVLRGEMSLVGPRPQVQAEVELYDDSATRRLLLKPGITGLWQVSGRSNLSWDAAIRLDLYYVENRSTVGDLDILWKTLRAVLQRDGAV